MAMKDWNGDGKINGMDHYIEGEIFKDSSGTKGSSHRWREGNLSCFGFIISVDIGFVLEAIIFILLGIDVNDVPTIILLVVLLACIYPVASVLKKIGI